MLTLRHLIITLIMSSQSFSGVVFNSGDSLEHLPLEQVEIRTLIVDGQCLDLWRSVRSELDDCAVSARVDVIQIFNNPVSTSTPRAKYVFPLPARAAVCAFNMTTSSGRVIVGIAKEKGQAKAEFEQAIHERKKTALVEWASNDGTPGTSAELNGAANSGSSFSVFTISIGPVAGREQVTTTISVCSYDASSLPLLSVWIVCTRPDGRRLEKPSAPSNPDAGRRTVWRTSRRNARSVITVIQNTRAVHRSHSDARCHRISNKSFSLRNVRSPLPNTH